MLWIVYGSEKGRPLGNFSYFESYTLTTCLLSIWGSLIIWNTVKFYAIDYISRWVACEHSCWLPHHPHPREVSAPWTIRKSYVYFFTIINVYMPELKIFQNVAKRFKIPRFALFDSVTLCNYQQLISMISCHKVGIKNEWMRSSRVSSVWLTMPKSQQSGV
jgi:hypothetical protein